MIKKALIISCVVLFISVISVYLLDREEPDRETGLVTGTPVKTNVVTVPKGEAQELKPVANPNGKKAKEDAADSRGKKAVSDTNSDAEPEDDDYPETIEEIREQIYDLNIEHVSDIELIDEIVQTGDADTRPFWEADWASADSWKKKSNGFSLEHNDEGKLIFSPDEQTARAYTFFENPLEYTYDEVNREFVSETDFHGKPIYNVAKFIKDDVLVMMTISGEKVNLQIYDRNAGQE